ncbi:hypothetical protein ACFOKI_12725 [Sphingomonas qilianensis]|uniref:Uncharacterized protein n=1 Tax=Sphingomonas qilianensis TaxID=1736690 RepID=A0ABU9XNJ0_9SPHN
MSDTAENSSKGTTGATDEKTIYDQAQEAVTAAIESATKSVTAAFETALDAAKENPKTAAAIAAGAAAAVAGAAFGVSKLLEDSKPAASKNSGTKSASAKKN